MEAILDQSLPTPAGLVAAARRGDRDAFRMLVEPDLAAALGTARIVTRSEADASDAVQEALLSAWQGLDSLREPDAFRAWFRRHVVRAALRAATRRGRVLELDLAAIARRASSIERSRSGPSAGRSAGSTPEIACS